MPGRSPRPVSPFFCPVLPLFMDGVDSVLGVPADGAHRGDDRYKTKCEGFTHRHRQALELTQLEKEGSIHRTGQDVFGCSRTEPIDSQSTVVGGFKDSPQRCGFRGDDVEGEDPWSRALKFGHELQRTVEPFGLDDTSPIDNLVRRCSAARQIPIPSEAEKGRVRTDHLGSALSIGRDQGFERCRGIAEYSVSESERQTMDESIGNIRIASTVKVYDPGRARMAQTVEAADDGGTPQRADDNVRT